MHPVNLRWVSVVDGTGFAAPVEAFRLLLPEDWRPEGGVFWVPQIHTPGMCVQVQFRALSPDGTAGVEFLPHYVWDWSDDPVLANQLTAAGTSMMPPLSAAEFVRTMVLPSQRPGCYILGSTQDPVSAHQRALRNRGANWADSDVARVRITWRIGRTPVEEDVYCAVDDVMSYVTVEPGAPPAIRHALVAQDIICVRFPVGKHADWSPLLDTIVDSVTHNPAWTAAVQQAMDETHAPSPWGSAPPGSSPEGSEGATGPWADVPHAT